MAWKLRKDKLKADSPTDAETPPDESAASSDSAQVAIATPPPAEASQEPRFEDTPAFAPEPQFGASEPHFADEEPQAAPIALGGEPIVLGGEAESSEPSFDDVEEAISLGAQGPISLDTQEPAFGEPAAPEAAASHAALSAFAPYQPSEPIAPPVADERTLPEAEREVIAPSPPVTETPEMAPDREAIAPGLVTTDTESGIPRVAPFIVDAPPPAPEPAVKSGGMHSVVLRLGNLSATFFLVKDVTTIGRPDAAVQNYPDIEVELDDGVSRRHAEIRRQGDAFYLVDVGSTNGTILNGETLTPHQPAPLQSGDRIRIGERTEIQFE